jgi:hypothetical protein
MSANVVWALVNYGPIFSPVYSSHLAAAAHAAKTLGAVVSTDRQYTHQAEVSVVDAFLETDATHLFMCESDMIVPQDAVTKLLQLAKPIASGLYFLRGGHGQPCLYQRALAPAGQDDISMSPVTLFPTEKPFRLNGCPGLGCVLIERQVFAQVPKPWFTLSHGGSDMYFYTQVRKAGIEVWVDPTVRCDQIEYQIWSYADYERRLREDPGFAASGTLIGAPVV